MTQAEFSRPTRVPVRLALIFSYFWVQSIQPGLPSCSGASVRVSFLTVPGSPVKNIRVSSRTFGFWLDFFKEKLGYAPSEHA